MTEYQEEVSERLTHLKAQSSGLEAGQGNQKAKH